MFNFLKPITTISNLVDSLNSQNIKLTNDNYFWTNFSGLNNAGYLAAAKIANVKFKLNKVILFLNIEMPLIDKDINNLKVTINMDTNSSEYLLCKFSTVKISK